MTPAESPDHEDRRVVGGCPGGAEQRRVAHEHDRSGRRVDLLAIDHEDGVSRHDGKELLVAVRSVLLVVGLVMLYDHLVSGVPGRGVDAERLDVEMATDEMERTVRVVRALRVDLGLGVHVGESDRAVRCDTRIAHDVHTATLTHTRNRTRETATSPAPAFGNVTRRFR